MNTVIMLSLHWQLKAIIWDLDGTILNSFWPGFEALKKIMLKNGLPTTTFVEKRLFNAWGKSSVEVISEGYNLTLQTAQKIAVEWEAAPRALNGEIKLFPGVKELLCFSQKSGLVNCLFTSREQPNGNSILLRNKVEKNFSFVWETGDKSPEFRKPHKAALVPTLDYLLRYHGIKPQECLLVGDTVTDMETGKNAKLGDTVLVKGGPSQDLPENFLPACNILNSVKELRGWLEIRVK